MGLRVDIDEFLPWALVHAPNCSDLIAYRYLREAARDFCERTKAWRETDEMRLDPMGCEAICTVPDADIVSIENAAVDGVPLEPVTLAWLDEHRAGWERRTEEGSPQFITQVEPNTVAVFPRSSGRLSMRLVLKPSLTAMTMPAFLLGKWASDIGKGAAAQILLLPIDDGGGDPAKAADLGAAFQRRINAEMFSVAKGQQRAPLRTKASFF
ncbi:phage adaptor protein [Shinella pollutisoli]|uniref:Uncharacterized protein n=1 Tax=Shinella pollutisoli TaxID=2250594 RepID=A0ABV7DKD0_9HYPH|nr:hypothetical protein [Shinella pollutisoli]